MLNMSNMKMTISAICNGETLTTISNDNHTWYIDEPEAFGGEDKAPSPVHTLLGAIAGCIIASGYNVAKEHKLDLGNMEINISGDISSNGFWGDNSENTRVGFTEIDVEISGNPFWSKDEKEVWLDEVQRRCPVIDNIIQPTQLRLSWRN
jgi:hypothetical protein